MIYSNKTPAYHHDDTLLIKDMWDLGVSGSQIAMSLAKAQRIHESLGYLLMSWNILILVPEDKCGKFKEEDFETNLDRLKFLTQSFQKPDFEVAYTIATVPHVPFKDSEIFTSLWPFKKQWIGDGDYVMIKEPFPTGFDSYHVKTRGISLDKAFKHAEDNNLKVKMFDYKTKWSDLVEDMIHCKYIISERSTLLALALFTNTPTFMLSAPAHTIYLDGKERPVLFGNGNLGMTWNIDYYDKHITQKYIDSPFFNVDHNLNLDKVIKDEMHHWLGR